MAKVSNIQIEDAVIKFRNFRGETDKFNTTGKRTFAVLLDHEMAVSLEEEGWNVKYLKPLEEGDDPQPYLSVEVKFNPVPPTVRMISGKKSTKLDEDSVGLLDYAEIETADLIISPYKWEVNGRSGIKAYLKKAWFTIVQDRFEEKYADVDIDDETTPF